MKPFKRKPNSVPFYTRTGRLFNKISKELYNGGCIPEPHWVVNMADVALLQQRGGNYRRKTHQLTKNLVIWFEHPHVRGRSIDCYILTNDLKDVGLGVVWKNEPKWKVWLDNPENGYLLKFVARSESDIVRTFRNVSRIWKTYNELPLLMSHAEKAKLCYFRYVQTTLRTPDEILEFQYLDKKILTPDVAAQFFITHELKEITLE